MQNHNLLAMLKGKRETGERTIFGLSLLEISFAILLALIVTSIVTDERLGRILDKLRGPLPSPIVVMESSGLVYVRANPPTRSLQSEQLESFEFFWRQDNPNERLVQVMRDGSFVIYRAERL